MIVTMTEKDPTPELIERGRRGDRAALGEATERVRPRLLQFIEERMGHEVRRLLGPEDVLQETFARSLELLDRFEWRGRDSFFRWLAAIAEHLILNATKKTARAPLRLDVDPRASAVSPSRAERREERFDRLKGALQSLPGEQREAIQLTRIDGLPVAEAARRLGKSPEAVKRTISRALRKLRGLLGDTESFRLPPRRLDRGKNAGGQDD
jgi:RNA polymerase sigma-70 factor (ECF subfamily)